MSCQNYSEQSEVTGKTFPMPTMKLYKEWRAQLINCGTRCDKWSVSCSIQFVLREEVPMVTADLQAALDPKLV